MGIRGPFLLFIPAFVAKAPQFAPGDHGQEEVDRISGHANHAKALNLEVEDVAQIERENVGDQRQIELEFGQQSDLTQGH